VNSLEEAIDWVKRSPSLTNEDHEVEIRPFIEWENASGE
jgi:hypothetical protein